MRSSHRPDWKSQRLSRTCELGRTRTDKFRSTNREPLPSLRGPQTRTWSEFGAKEQTWTGAPATQRRAGEPPGTTAPHLARCRRGRPDIAAKRMQNRPAGGPRSTAVRSVVLSSNLNDLPQLTRTKSGNVPNDSLLKSKPTRSFSARSCNFRGLIDSFLTCRHSPTRFERAIFPSGPGDPVG
jgi:hypothetical protein